MSGDGRTEPDLPAIPRPGRWRSPEFLSRLVASLLIGWMAVGAPGCDRSGPAADPPGMDASPESSADVRVGDSRQRFWQAFREASRARRAGDRLAAIAAYRDALEQDPDHGDSLYYLAQLRYARGEVGAARRHLERLTAVEPRALRGWQQLAEVDSTPLPGWLPDLESAAVAQQRALELNPGESRNHTLGARIAAYRGERGRAREAAATALGYNRNATEAQRIRLWLALRGDRPDGGATLELDRDPCAGGDGCRDRPDVLLVLAAIRAGLEVRMAETGTIPESTGAPLVAPASPRLVLQGVRTAPRDGTRSTGSAESGNGVEVVDLDGDGSGDVDVRWPAAPGRARVLWRGGSVAEGGASVGSVARAWSTGDRGSRMAGGAERRDADDRERSSDGSGIRPIPWWAARLGGRAGPSLIVLGGGGRPVRSYRRHGGIWREVTGVEGLPGDLRGAVGTAADVDGDGLTDLFLANLPSEAIVGEGGVEVAAIGSGVAGEGDAAAADLWGRWYRARPDGGFDAIGTPVPGPLSAAAAADFDGDGDVDLLVARDPGPAASAAGHLLWHLGPDEEAGAPRAAPLSVVLWRNEEGRLRPDGEGVPPARCAVRDFGLVDFDDDGGVDVYLATGGPAPDRVEPDRLWEYRDGRFRDASLRLGALRYDVTLEAHPGSRAGSILLVRGGLVPGDPSRRIEISVPGPQNSNE